MAFLYASVKQPETFKIKKEFVICFEIQNITSSQHSLTGIFSGIVIPGFANLSPVSKLLPDIIGTKLRQTNFPNRQYRLYTANNTAWHAFTSS